MTIPRLKRYRLRRRVPSFLRRALLLAALAYSNPSLQAAAPPHCDSGNPANWLTAAQMDERLSAEGWAISQIVSRNGCWAVRGNKPDGTRVTGYFDPLSGQQLQIDSTR